VSVEISLLYHEILLG